MTTPHSFTSNTQIFKDLIDETSDYFGIEKAYIEKDFHIYRILKSIAQSDYADRAIFKGGTALSRVWKIINRFSEDIDICVNPETKKSFEKLKKEKDFISKLVEKDFPKIDNHEEEIKGGTRRKTIHPFPKIVAVPGQQTIKEHIILEVTAVRPTRKIGCAKKLIASFITDFLIQNSQKELLGKYDLIPFKFLVMLPEYTLSDKLCRMLKEANKPDSVKQIGLKIRDLYDIHELLRNKHVSEIFYSDSFLEIFYDTKLDEQENGNIIPKFSDTPLFSNPAEILALQKENYEKFKMLVYSRPPELLDIIKTLEKHSSRFRQFDGAKMHPTITP